MKPNLRKKHQKCSFIRWDIQQLSRKVVGCLLLIHSFLILFLNGIVVLRPFCFWLAGFLARQLHLPAGNDQVHQKEVPRRATGRRECGHWCTGQEPHRCRCRRSKSRHGIRLHMHYPGTSNFSLPK